MVDLSSHQEAVLVDFLGYVFGQRPARLNDQLLQIAIGAKEDLDRGNAGMHAMRSLLGAIGIVPVAATAADGVVRWWQHNKGRRQDFHAVLTVVRSKYHTQYVMALGS